MSRRPRRFTDPQPELQEEAAVEFDAPVEALDPRARRLMAIEGVVGVDWGQTEAGEVALVVYIRDDEARARLPAIVDGTPIQAVTTGEIEAYR